MSGRANPGQQADHAVFLGDGAGGFVDVAPETGINEGSAADIPTMGFGVGDLDQDGWAEVFFGNGSPEAGSVNAFGTLRMDGDQLVWLDRIDLIDVPAEGEGLPPYPYRSHGTLFADIDADGVPELLIGNGGGMVTEPHRVFRSADAGSTLRVALVADGPNATAVGARVRVSDGPPGEASWQRVRQDWPDVGFNSFDGQPLAFGVGACNGPFHVTVWWPDGQVETFSDMAGPQATLRHGTGR